MKFIKILAAAVLGLFASTATADDSKTFSGSTLYGHCFTPRNTVSFDTGVKAGAAMQLTADDIKTFAGCKITAIAVANGSLSSGAAVTELPITLFVSNALGTTLTPTVEFNGVMDLSNPLEYTEYALPEPIEITEGMNPLYFGYQMICDITQYNPIAVDYSLHSETDGPGDWFGEYSSKTNGWNWSQLRDQVGMNCIRVKIEGENMRANNVQIMEGNIPAFVAPGNSMEVGVYLNNTAFNTVNSVTFKCTLGDNEAQTITLPLNKPLYYNEFTLAPLYFNVSVDGVEGADIPVKVELAGVNEEAALNNAAYIYKNISSTFHSFEGGYDKNVVAEIATGTWCGWCPRGIVAVEKMAEYDTEGRFIPIAVHGGNDPMLAQSYNSLTSLTGGSYPAVVLNRDIKSYGVQDPSFDIFKAVYDVETSYRALVKPSVESMSYNADTKKLTVNASAEFAVNSASEFAFAYALIEDEVGPYYQTNYYANGAGGALDWWDRQGSSVQMLYNSVARYIYAYNGVKNSIAANVEVGQTYTHSAAVSTNAATNIGNCSIVLMVINRKTGRIENAVKVAYDDESAIESIEAELNNEPAVYFDLQGREVSSPREGQIYIERRGSETRKVRF